MLYIVQKLSTETEFTEVFYQMTVRERYLIPAFQLLLVIIAGTKTQPSEWIRIATPLHP